MVSPILPFAVGALMSRNEIVDRQDELTGQIVDTVSENYFAKSGEEKTRLKNVDKIFNQLTTQYPVQVVEAFAHAGFLDSGDLGTAMSFIQNVKPEAIEQLKTMDSKDLNLVFQNNNSKILKSVGSKENVVASNLNRGQLKNLSDLYFKDEFDKAKKEGTFDTARNLLFGGPIIKEGDVPSAILGLEKETEKIVPDLEKPDENILGVFANLPGGPLISGASGDTSGISDSEFRLRSNTAVDNAMQSLGLGGQYTRGTDGSITTSKLSDLDGAKFGYVTDLVNVIFNQPDFNFNTYGEVGAKVANIVKDNDRLILSSFQKFKNSGADITPLIPSEDKKSNVLNVNGYNTFIAYNTSILARFANSKSFAYREYVMSTYGGGAYRRYFEEYLKQLEEGSN
jgi:hypothetical protein